MNVKKLIKAGMLIGASLAATAVMANEFKFVHVLDQGYWYSRYNLGHLVMRSGNGETFMPEMSMVQKMVALVSDDLSTATPPKNPALLKRVYNTGNPFWVNASNQNGNDFKNFRWSPAVDEQTSLEAFGWTAMKEIEWSKQFNIDFHFGAPNTVKVAGAQQRFAGVVLCAEALVQTQELATNPSAFDGSEIAGQYVALAAVANLAQYIATESTPSMASNRCAKVAAMMNKKPAIEVAAELLQFADKLYAQAGAPSTIREKSLAIQGLTWYAAAQVNKRAEVVAKIKSLGDELAKIRSARPIELAYLIRGLIEVSRVTTSAKYMKLVGRHYKALVADFSTTTGLFKTQTTYTTEDAAALIGALNAAKLFAGGRVNQEQLTVIFTQFFNTLLNKAKMQISAPPIAAIPAYERKPDALSHRHPNLPVPHLAGGDYGVAPVYAAAVSFKNGVFVQEKDRFDSAGAMHLANEMIWFHHGEVNGFPEF